MSFPKAKHPGPDARDLPHRVGGVEREDPESAAAISRGNQAHTRKTSSTRAVRPLRFGPRIRDKLREKVLQTTNNVHWQTLFARRF